MQEVVLPYRQGQEGASPCMFQPLCERLSPPGHADATILMILVLIYGFPCNLSRRGLALKGVPRFGVPTTPHHTPLWPSIPDFTERGCLVSAVHGRVALILRYRVNVMRVRGGAMHQENGRGARAERGWFFFDQH